jgi:hypothetical protein
MMFSFHQRHSLIHHMTNKTRFVSSVITKTRSSLDSWLPVRQRHVTLAPHVRLFQSPDGLVHPHDLASHPRFEVAPEQLYLP